MESKKRTAADSLVDKLELEKLLIRQNDDHDQDKIIYQRIGKTLVEGVELERLIKNGKKTEFVKFLHPKLALFTLITS